MNTYFENASVYVGTYKKYANFDLSGEWLNLAEFRNESDFLAACKEIHKDERNPVFMFQDWEGIPDMLIKERGLNPKFFELRDAFEGDEEDAAKGYFLWLKLTGEDFSDVENSVQSYWDSFVGKYESETEFAAELADICGDLPEWAKHHFDYDSYAAELFSENYRFWEGFVFHWA